MFEVLSQPASGFFGSRLIQEIERSDYKHYDRLVLLVAYARHSGVLRLKPAIEKFVAAGGEVHVAVGVGQGNTTYEALEELSGLGINLYVYHDSNLAQTFHPKMYLLSLKDERAWISVGSSNLTTAGHYSNYEINVVADLNLATDRDKKIFKDITAATKPYLDTTGNCCRSVTAKLLDQLKEEGYVLTESGAKRSFKAQAKKNAQTKLFGTVKLAKPLSLIIKKKAAVKAQAKKLKMTGALFWKRLSNYDASKKSSPGQIQIPIGYLKRFPPLSNPTVTKSGATQSDVHLDVLFVEKQKPSVLVKNARAVLYEPAPTHKRKNDELRFTFLNRDILNKLEAGDVLIFRRTDKANTWFTVELVKEAKAEAFEGKTGTKLPDGI